jgi:hypothetical protein
VGREYRRGSPRSMQGLLHLADQCSRDPDA